MAKPNGDQLSDKRKLAFEKLNIPAKNRAILSLDGGGMRGILTIQLLKKLEEIAGIPCYELFDMVAGTSTGGIITGLIVTGHTAVQIEELYISLIEEVFDKRKLHNRFINPPAFSKKKYREMLKKTVNDVTIEEVCRQNQIDILITAQDIAAAEETFFTSFLHNDASCYGTYRTILLRAAMEATMSAPTYFYPLERFLDGGTTTYNNPSLAAYIEATSYSCSTPENCEYKLTDVSLFSFGTGISRMFYEPEDAVDPKGIDIKFWLDWIMTQTGQEASAMQVNALRSTALRKTIDFRRFQISLDPDSIKKLPNKNNLDQHKYDSPWLHDLSESILGNIDMADVTRFDLMKAIGEQMAEYIVKVGNNFRSDLVNDRNNDLLVKYFGDVNRIQIQMKDPKWLDNYKA